MRKVLLDTNAYAALLRGNDTVLDVLGQAEIVYMSAIVLGELHTGFRGGRQEVANRKQLDAFIRRPTVRILHVTQDTSEIFGTIKHNLKTAGTPIPINDVWIAAHTIESGSFLVTFDDHFSSVPGILRWQP
jgi:tRNA(fMet)-specific endonuclease VapC